MITFSIIFVFMVLLGAFTLMYQINRLVVMDAESRGLKHPNFWGIFSMSGGSGRGGLLLYLIGRNRIPSQMTEAQISLFLTRKKRAGISLCFIALGTIGLTILGITGLM